MQISIEEVERIAKLSRLSLSEEEKKSMQINLEEVLGHLEKLNELDTSDVLPTAHILPVNNVFREDIVEPSMDREQLIQNAPEREDGCFIVPKVIE